MTISPCILASNILIEGIESWWDGRDPRQRTSSDFLCLPARQVESGQQDLDLYDCEILLLNVNS